MSDVRVDAPAPSTPRPASAGPEAARARAVASRRRRGRPVAARLLVHGVVSGGYALALVVTNLLASWFVYSRTGGDAEVTLAGATVLAATAAFMLAPLDDVERAAPRGSQLSWRPLRPWAIAFAAAAAIGLWPAPDLATWATWLFAWSALGVVALVGWHAVAGWLLDRPAVRAALTPRVALLGLGPAGLPSALLDRMGAGLRPVAVCAASPLLASAEDVPSETVRLDTVDELAEACADLGVERVLVTAPPEALERVDAAVAPLRAAAVDVDLLHGDGRGAERLIARPLSDGQALLKRVEDVVLASLAILFLAPVLLTIAVAIKLESHGPVIFRQLRDGHRGVPFEVFKFRSMVVHDPGEHGVAQARREDPRVTRVGRVLRRTSLDELAQVFNVLRGDMSIVGPRPHAVEHGRIYAPRVPGYTARHRMKPGITGWAQVNGWRGETDTLDKMEARVAHDLWYADNWSLWLDLRIVFLTVRVLWHPNAY